MQSSLTRPTGEASDIRIIRLTPSSFKIIINNTDSFFKKNISKIVS